MATRHTPGPWTALRCEHGWHIGPQPDGVCSIFDNTGGYKHDEQVANAHLIAQAPTLIEYLQTLHELSLDDPQAAMIELQSDYTAELIARATQQETP